MDNREVLLRRSDLSPFLIHLTKDTGKTTAAQNLTNIISSGRIDARNPYGAAKGLLTSTKDIDSQKVVCFTETPLEYIHLHFAEIPDRDHKFEPYGIAASKSFARKKGANAVWYIDQTPGHDWLSHHNLEPIIQGAVKTGFLKHDISKLTPFIEHSGVGKDFAWEREWRIVGDFLLPESYLGLCPTEHIHTFENLTQGKIRFVDPSWGLERMISHLAGVDSASLTKSKAA